MQNPLCFKGFCFLLIYFRYEKPQKPSVTAIPKGMAIIILTTFYKNSLLHFSY